jgi:hypothetical protein
MSIERALANGESKPAVTLAGIKEFQHAAEKHLIAAQIAAGLPDSHFDTPEVRAFLEFISHGKFEVPHHSKVRNLVQSATQQMAAQVRFISLKFSHEQFVFCSEIATGNCSLDLIFSCNSSIFEICDLFFRFRFFKFSKGCFLTTSLLTPVPHRTVTRWLVCRTLFWILMTGG